MRQFLNGIIQVWSGLNNLIWVCLMPCVRHVRDDCFQRTSQADTAVCRLLVNSQSGSMCVHCYQAGDWFLCPSCLPFPLCFKAQFREAHDVLTCTLWITLLKDASAQKILQKVMEVVLFCHLWWRVVAVQGTSSLWSIRVMSCKDEANVGSQSPDCRSIN